MAFKRLKKNKVLRKKIRRIPGNEFCEKFLLQIILENEENCMRGEQCSWQYPAVKPVSHLGFQGTILESSSALVSSQSKGSWKAGCCPLLSSFCPLSWLESGKFLFYLFYILDFLIISLYIKNRKMSGGVGSSATC